MPVGKVEFEARLKTALKARESALWVGATISCPVLSGVDVARSLPQLQLRWRPILRIGRLGLAAIVDGVALTICGLRAISTVFAGDAERPRIFS